MDISVNKKIHGYVKGDFRKNKRKIHPIFYNSNRPKLLVKFNITKTRNKCHNQDNTVNRENPCV